MARARHADRRGGDRGRRRGSRFRRHAPDRRDDDVQLRAPGARPDRQPRGQVPLHVGRPDPLPHGDARPVGRGGAGGGAALAGVRELVRAPPRPRRRDAFDPEGRQGAPEERDPGRQPGDLHGERGALQPQGRGARGGVHDPARPRRREAPGQGRHDRGVEPLDAVRAAGRRAARQERDRGRGGRPAHAAPARRGHHLRLGAQDEPLRGGRGGLALRRLRRRDRGPRSARAASTTSTRRSCA